jgi:hypothetical protein
MISADMVGSRPRRTLKPPILKPWSPTCSLQYSNPLRVVAFNLAEDWSRDALAGVAQELRRRCDEQFREIPLSLKDFIDRYASRFHDVQIPLPMRLF